MPKVTIYTDASFDPVACHATGGFVMLFPDSIERFSAYLGIAKDNTHAELLAIIYALKALDKPHCATLIADNESIVRIANRDANTKHNLESWSEYWQLASIHNIRIKWYGRQYSIYTIEAHELSYKMLKRSK